tara:strand:- start:308 stop:1645 length:1338 start_codon:yes stop_codon:yes gene_type:complete
MRLVEAANAIAAVRTADDNTKQQEKLLYDFLCANKDSVSEFCALLYGPALLKPEQVMRAIHHDFAIFPEEFELLEGAPLIPTLVSESPSECDVDMSIPEALASITSIKEGVSIKAVMGRMDAISADAIWRRALGDAPALPRKRLMRAIAHGTGYSPERLTSALAVEPMETVLSKALEGSLSDNFAIEPGHPFKAPSFAAWRYWSVPFEHTYYEKSSGPRYYAHKVQGETFLYDSQGVLVKGEAPRITYDGDCVALVDEKGTVLEWLHTEDEPNIWCDAYSNRAIAPKKVKDSQHLRQLCETLQEGEVLRLLDETRPHIHSQHKGGFILPRRVYELPLLITAGKVKSDGIWVSLRIAAMDGFDPIHVGYANIKRTDVPQNPILKDATSKFVWEELNPPLVGSFHALRAREGKLEGAYLVSLTTEKGMSDVMQYGDLWSIDGHGQAR